MGDKQVHELMVEMAVLKTKQDAMSEDFSNMREDIKGMKSTVDGVKIWVAVIAAGAAGAGGVIGNIVPSLF